VVRQNFGSQKHFEYLSTLLSSGDGEGSPIVDLTPFHRLGNRVTFQRLLLAPGLLKHSFLLVASETLFDDLTAALQDSSEHLEPRIVHFHLRNGQALAKRTSSLSQLLELRGRGDEPSVLPAESYSRLRLDLGAQSLLEAVSRVTLKPPDSRWKGGTQDVGEVSFLRMPNGMLVSHFVLMKALLNSAESIDRIAYEVAAHVCQGFCPQADEMWPDLLVASSDHSYLIGAAVQRFTGIRCAVIDRIGLLPGRRLTRDTISLDVTGKCVALIVDVSATASEMERAASLLITRGAQLQSIVCCVWLECAIPRFVEWFRFVPLCRPKRSLNFVYRSAP
jgi:hypothetical protein